MKFREFLAKEMTSTGDVAGFSRICLPMVTRTWMPNVVFDMDVKSPKSKKKVKSQPQVKD